MGIMTSEFTDAAELMAKSLGAEGYAFIVVDHPISSASPEQLAEQAQRAVREGIGILVEGLSSNR